jgi:hypothetical protein
MQSGMASFVESRLYNAAAPVKEPELKKRPIPAEFLQDYLQAVVDAQYFKVSNLRNWNLIQCYAELQFKLNGGTKCPVCRAHVRHIVPTQIQKADGTAKDYTCLCTRCFEAERATSKCVVMSMGDATVTYYPREYGATSQHGKTANQISRKAKAKAAQK